MATVNSLAPPKRPILSYLVPSHRRVRGLELLALFGLPLVISQVSVLIATFLGASETYLVATALGTGGLTLVAVLLFQKWTLPDLGFHPIRRNKLHLLWQIPAIQALSATAGVLFSLVVSPPEQSDSEKLAQDFSLGTATIVISVACIAFIGPVLEEIFFRRFLMGFLDQVFLRRLSPVVTIVLSTLASSVIFGLAHAVPTIMVYTFVLGCGAAILIRYHQSLWAGVILHVVNNSMVALSALFLFFTGMN